MNLKSGILTISPIIIGTLLAYAFLTFQFAEQKTDFTALALGKDKGLNNHSYYIQESPIICQNLEASAPCIGGVKKRDLSQTILWLGNSQLYGINQYNPNDVNASRVAFDNLQPEGLDVLTISPPNGNPEEHYLIFEYIRQYAPIKFLALGLCFDDFREKGIRNSISIALLDGDTKSSLQKNTPWQGNLPEIRPEYYTRK